jgi:hypothetical protein
MKKCNTLCFVWALKRSGAHGVEQWMFPHYKSHLFLNNRNPAYPLSGKDSEKVLDKKTQLDALIIGFEDFPFFNGGKINSCEDIVKNAYLVGRYDKLVNVVVLRDIFNMMASRLRSDPKYGIIRSKMDADSAIVELWKMYAREFLRQTNNLPDDTVFISFNKWFVDKEYRKQISKRLGVEFTDEGKQVFGARPSSFDRWKYKDRAGELQVLERWHSYIDDSEFIRLVSDREAVDLSQEIFGEAPQVLLERLRL